jgi:Domain of unknown function (DUF4349)
MCKAAWVMSALMLASCGPGDPASSPAATKEMAAMDVAGDAAMPATLDVAGAPVSASEPPPAPGPATPPVGISTQIAYSYSMGLELAAKKVIALRDAHLKACTAAGPQRCQIIGSTSSQQGSSFVTAEVKLRGEPKWLEAYRGQITQSAKEADGKVIASAIMSEDLTRQLVDVGARLKAQQTLRDRLQTLLANRQGKLGELLEVERELARVQGDIDSMTSQLAVMRARVAMSDLSINYQSEGVAVSDQTAGPIGQAVNDFLGIVASGLAGLIRLTAFLLPFALVLGPLLWWLSRGWRARRARRLADSASGA